MTGHSMGRIAQWRTDAERVPQLLEDRRKLVEALQAAYYEPHTDWRIAVSALLRELGELK